MTLIFHQIHYFGPLLLPLAVTLAIMVMVYRTAGPAVKTTDAVTPRESSRLSGPMDNA
jgi:hypothetical protein